MALKETQTETRFLLIWLGFIQISGFVTFKEGFRFDSVGRFNNNAKEGESFDRVDYNPLSRPEVGRLIIWPDQTHNGDGGNLSSDLPTSSFSLPHNGKNSHKSGDAGWMKLQPLWGQVYGLNTLYTPTIERLLGMRPRVDCVGDLMTLTVHGKEAYFGSNFLIDRGSISPLPLSQLPSECGHTLQRTWRDFIFNIPYNGCYVSQERNTYILPLLWWGLPVKMFCSSPTLVQSSPTVSCYTNGMIVKLPRPSMNLKIKVINEWLPLMRASAKCGYSVVSHPEGVVIHAPYMPCTEAKDRMFTLSMATEREFNLSCPALLLSLPSKESDVPSNNYTSVTQSPVSTTLSPTPSEKTTQPIEIPSQTTSMSSTIQKLSPSLTYQTYFKPFLLFQPNVPPTVVPDPAAVAPLHITQGPQAPIYLMPDHPKPPQTLYPWYPKPNIFLPPDPTQRSFVPPYASKPLSPALTPMPSRSPLVYLLKPTTFPKDKIPKTPPVQWAPMYPPSNLVYPLYPRKTFVDASATFAQASGGLYPSQSQPRPNEPPYMKPSEQYALPKPMSAPPIPVPTRRVEPLQFPHFPWYRPLPQHHLEMPSVPVNVPQISIASTTQLPPQPSKQPDHSYTKGPPFSLHFDFTPSTDPTTAPSKMTEVAHTFIPTVAPQAQCNLSHALSFLCPTFCPGHPLISYHHHNHHHFGHPFPVPFFGSSIHTKVTAEIQSPPITTSSSTPALFPFIKGMGYNYDPYSLKGVGSPQAIQYLKETESPLIKSTPAPDTSKVLTRPTTCSHIFRTLPSSDVSPRALMKPVNIASIIHPLEATKPLSRSLQNAPIADPPANLVRSPKPAVYYAERQPYFLRRGGLMPMFVAATNSVGPLSQSERKVSTPTMPPANGKNLLMNYWYQPASYSRPPMSDAPSEVSFKQISVHSLKSSNQSTTLPQPKRTHETKPSMQLNGSPSMKNHNSVPVKSQLYDPQSGTPPVPIFRALELFDSYRASAVQTNQKALLSTHHPDGSKGFRGPLHTEKLEGR